MRSRVWCSARCGSTEGVVLATVDTCKILDPGRLMMLLTLMALTLTLTRLTTAGRYSTLGGLMMMVCTGNLRSLALLP